MTVQTTTLRADYTGNGATTAFIIPFYFLDNTHVKVVRTQISTGVATILTLTSDYTITGAGVSNGGTLTMTSAPTSDQRVSVLRNVPNTQLIHYVLNDPFPAATHEAALDQLTMEIQQTNEAITRTLQLPAGETSSGVTLASAVSRASKLLGFDSAGNPVAVAPAAQSASALQALLASPSGASYIGVTWFGSVLGVLTDLTASIGATLIGWIQTGAGAVARSIASKLYDTISIKDFGGSAGASAATNTAALQAAIVEAVARGKGGVDIGPGGTWAFTAGTNYATRDIAIIGVGKPILDFSAGTGIGFKLDAGGSGANIRGMQVKNFIFKGGPSITDIFYHRGIVASLFEDLEAREGTATGFALKFGVLNTYINCRVSNDSLAMTTTPAISFLLDTDGTAGNRCQANTFINCDASGKGATSTSIGFKLIDATLNKFIGGTAESLKQGIDIAAACRLNTFDCMDLEHNVDEDIIDAGTGTVYNGVSSAGGGTASGVQITGHGATFTGGAYAIVSLGAASTDTTFNGVGFSSAGGLTGTGTYKRYGCYTVDGAGLRNGTLSDVTGQIVAVIAGAGLPLVKQSGTGVSINGTATPLFSIAFSGFWCVRDSTSAGIAFGTCDSGVPEVTVLSNTIPATVVFSMVSGILNARTTAGTVTRTMIPMSFAVTGG